MEINKLRINNFDLYHIPNNKFKSFTIGVESHYYQIILLNIMKNTQPKRL